MNVEPIEGGADPRWLLLDLSGGDARWLILSVAGPDDVLPARMAGRRYQDWQQVTEWAAQRLGYHPSLIPVGAKLWRIAGGAPR